MTVGRRQSPSRASTEGEVDATCVQFGSRGNFPLPASGDIFVVCNCTSYRCMDYLVLYNYDVASAVMSIIAR